jgi:ribonuclease HI
LEGIVSNSEAEYAALYNAVGMLEQLDIRHSPCTIKGDAQGALRQLAGEWPCYEAHLNSWLDKIELKIKELHLKPSLEVITREQNKEADKLARQALENKIIHSHTKIE